MRGTHARRQVSHSLPLRARPPRGSSTVPARLYHARITAPSLPKRHRRYRFRLRPPVEDEDTSFINEVDPRRRWSPPERRGRWGLCQAARGALRRGRSPFAGHSGAMRRHSNFRTSSVLRAFAQHLLRPEEPMVYFVGEPRSGTRCGFDADRAAVAAINPSSIGSGRHVAGCRGGVRGSRRTPGTRSSFSGFPLERVGVLKRRSHS